ncbi:MAG: hypothetical protein EZS28_026946, partial [Streblomastix strix]
PSRIQRTRKHGGPQFRQEAGDVLATLVATQIMTPLKKR